MNYTGIGEAISLIENRDEYPTVDALKMAVAKLKQEQEIMVALQAELADEKATVKHLRKKAEFDMPPEMHGRFHNGQCPDACDTIDGPCACGATHSAKEWISKLQDKLNKHRWIPVEERLPEACNSETEYSPKVLVTHCRNEFVTTDYYLTKKQCWKSSPPWRYTHWKPISLP